MGDSDDPVRAMLDTQVIDAILDNPWWIDPLLEAVRGKRADLLATHVMIDELAQIPDARAERRATLLVLAAALCRIVLTEGLVGDFSRGGFARGSDNVELFEALRVGNIRHTRDAMIAITAAYECCPLVTVDAALARRAERQGVEVWTPEELARQVGWS